MEIIELKTLIDITNTNVRRPNQGTQQEYDQYKNWITLNQCIEIRSIITYDANPTNELVDIKGLGFGKDYKGKHRVWTWRFSPDRATSFSSDSGDLLLLIDGLDQIPVIKNLIETINIGAAVFELRNENQKNTVLKIISGNEQALS
jgi:hypothetical protein